MSKASLFCVEFTFVDFTGADFKTTDLTHARLHHANFSGVTNLTQRQLDSACGEDAIFSDTTLRLPRCPPIRHRDCKPNVD